MSRFRCSSAKCDQIPVPDSDAQVLKYDQMTVPDSDSHWVILCDQILVPDSDAHWVLLLQPDSRSRFRCSMGAFVVKRFRDPDSKCSG